MLYPTILAALHRLPSMTESALRNILDHLPLDRVTDWRLPDLVGVGIRPDRARMIFPELACLDVDSAERMIQQLQVRILTMADQSYPAALAEIASPPPVLYLRGTLPSNAATWLAVVGTRHPTPYGQTATTTLTRSVAARGGVIVSGLAVGIDGIAHRAAIDSRGATVAILGHGIDSVYPPEHHHLAAEILARGGALISEFPLGARPERHHFPQRNRIIAGLAQAVLLIEAGDKSGALITAKFALDANRDVLAVPGPITSPQSIGPNNWIRLGATLIRSPADVLEAINLSAPHLPFDQPVVPMLTQPEQNILYSFLAREPVHIDVLVEKSRLEPSVVAAALTLMEMKGAVRHLGGQLYIQA